MATDLDRLVASIEASIKQFERAMALAMTLRLKGSARQTGR